VSKLNLFAAALALAVTLPASVLAAPAPRAYAGVVPEGSSLMMVFANPVAGQETAFAAWYENHMREMAKLPGFVRIQRFQATSRQGRPDPAFGFVVLYEFSGDAEKVLGQIPVAVREGRMSAPDPRYVAKTETMVYRAVTPGVTPQ
jgi:hypothetical protein